MHPVAVKVSTQSSFQSFRPEKSKSPSPDSVVCHPRVTDLDELVLPTLAVDTEEVRGAVIAARSPRVVIPLEEAEFSQPVKVQYWMINRRMLVPTAVRSTGELLPPIGILRRKNIYEQDLEKIASRVDHYLQKNWEEFSGSDCVNTIFKLITYLKKAKNLLRFHSLLKQDVQVLKQKVKEHIAIYFSILVEESCGELIEPTKKIMAAGVGESESVQKSISQIRSVVNDVFDSALLPISRFFAWKGEFFSAEFILDIRKSSLETVKKYQELKSKTKVESNVEGECLSFTGNPSHQFIQRESYLDFKKYMNLMVSLLDAQKDRDLLDDILDEFDEKLEEASDFEKILRKYKSDEDVLALLDEGLSKKLIHIALNMSAKDVDHAPFLELVEGVCLPVVGYFGETETVSEEKLLQIAAQLKRKLAKPLVLQEY